jgi:hypothetical protein
MSGGREVAMSADKKAWLERNAVTCRVFKGRWSIRHCFRMYNDIKDLKIQMSTRGGGKVRRHESAYNPCERCKVLLEYRSNPQMPGGDEEHSYKNVVAF